MSSSLSKIPKTGKNVFKSNRQIMKNKKIIWNINYIPMGRKIFNDYWLNYLYDSFGINWFSYDPSWKLQLSVFAWTLRSSVWVVFNNFLLIDATDRNKISGVQKRLFFAVSLYPIHFFANTPFKFSWRFIPFDNISLVNNIPRKPYL